MRSERLIVRHINHPYTDGYDAVTRMLSGARTRNISRVKLLANTVIDKRDRPETATATVIM